MTMIQREYTVRFLTPAFLGNAEQSGQWRTPPFKALLRQWWRVAVAKSFNYDVAKMREVEGRLFGNAWLDHKENGTTVTDHCKSVVRMRLGAPSDVKDVESWGFGKQSGVAPERASPEMKYVGWGLIDRGQGVADRLAITDARTKRTEGERILRIAFPDHHASMPGINIDADLALALALINHFGSVGSRARNGWGSLALTPHAESPALADLRASVQSVNRSLADCLQTNATWASCIAIDEGQPLIWESPSGGFDSWGKTLLAIALTKKHVRKALLLGKSNLAERHILGLPVKDSDPAGDKDARMPSPLRFKVFERNGKLLYRLYAMPHVKPDAEKLKNLSPQAFMAAAQHAWPQIIKSLSQPASGVTRISA
jgi:CRISPR-associated protein Cmr1